MQVDLVPDPFVRGPMRIVVDESMTNSVIEFGYASAAARELPIREVAKQAKKLARSRKPSRGASSYVYEFLVPAVPTFAPDWAATTLPDPFWTDHDWRTDPTKGRYVLHRCRSVELTVDGARTGTARPGGFVCADGDRLSVLSASPLEPTSESDAIQHTSFDKQSEDRRSALMGLVGAISVVADPEGAFDALEGLGDRAESASPEAKAQAEGWAASARFVGGLSLPWEVIDEVQLATDYERVVMGLLCTGEAPRFSYRTTVLLTVDEAPTQDGLENVLQKLNGPNTPPLMEPRWLHRNDESSALTFRLDTPKAPYRPPALRH